MGSSSSLVWNLSLVLPVELQPDLRLILPALLPLLPPLPGQEEGARQGVDQRERDAQDEHEEGQAHAGEEALLAVGPVVAPSRFARVIQVAGGRRKSAKNLSWRETFA